MEKYTHFSMRERCDLLTFLDMKLSMSEISHRLNKHRSSIYRELSRNRTTSRYQPGSAHHQAMSRRPHKALKLQTDNRLYHYVYDHLKQGWSPEQMVGRMRLEKKSLDVCPETIYQYVYQHGQQTLWNYLPSERKKGKKRRNRKPSVCGYGEIRLVTKRPKNIEKRDRMGHWEGDLIEFSGSKKKTITTLVERKTRMVSLIKNKTKKSDTIMEKIAQQLNQFAPKHCKTITFDQGSECAHYKILEKQLGVKVYYGEPRSPWQKGSNENMNGRLRRYLPKQRPLSNQMTQQDLDLLADKMNTLPRKCLGFRTPKERFDLKINETQSIFNCEYSAFAIEYGKVLLDFLQTNKDLTL
jgi:IS30 family transposase